MCSAASERTPHLEDEFGDIVAKARVGHGLTLEMLAAEAGLSAAELADVEAYRLKPDADRLASLAQALGLGELALVAIADESWVPESVDPARLAPIIETVSVSCGGYGENAYIVACRETRSAAIVDPGGSVDDIRRRIEANSLDPALVLVTHAHSDHTGGLRQLAALWPDIRLANHEVERGSLVRSLTLRWEPARDRIGIALGSLKITPLATPGHTPGSVCYHVDGVCFVGDTLFAGSIGRPAGPDAYRRMLADTRAKVLSLPPQTVLLPGHGPPTTVAEELAHNPFFAS